MLDGPHTVTALTQIIGVRQYVTSKHLAVLRDAGIVGYEAKAKLRIYTIAPGLRAGLRKIVPCLDFGWGVFSIEGFFNMR